MSRRATTLALAAVAAMALCCGTAKAAATMEEAQKACEHLLGFPTCYGACTKWYTTDDPLEDKELVRRALRCYDEDNGWEGFKVEDVVTTGRRSNGTTLLGGGGTDAADPLEGVVAGGGGSGGGGGDNQSGAGGDSQSESASRPTPGEDIDDDLEVVKACLDGTRDPLFPPHLLAQVSRWGGASISYGDATVAIHETATTTRMMLAYGKTEWNDGYPHVTIDHGRIASRAGKTSYWHEFAKTVLHEFHHVLDMLSCRCGFPHLVRDPPLTWEEYEEVTEDNAQDDYRTIAACLP